MRRAAFTLIELILVMSLLVIMAALVVPALSRSMHGRDLKEEATRFVALTEYARSEAISQGVPVVVWVEAPSRRYGAEPKAGYDAASAPVHEYTAATAVQIQVSTSRAGGGHIEAATFGPDGTLTLESAPSINFIDRYGSLLAVVKSGDNWGYEIEKSR